MNTNRPMNMNRRRAIGAGAALTAVALLGRSGLSVAVPESTEQAIASFAGDAEVSEGALTLTAPEIAENGNSVPIAVKVDSPMTEDSYVDSVIILADGNPNPEVVTFKFTPASGVAEASTRMRLATTQDVIALAKMSDGSVHRASANVKVTIGGCGG